jgi:phage terminase large subunit-like protein
LTEGWTYATAWLPSGDAAASDWAVAAVWTKTIDGNLLLRDLARARLADTSAADLIGPLARRYGVDTTFVPRKQLTDAIRADVSRVGAGVTELALDGDLMARALAASAKQVVGNVWLPAGAPWAVGFTAECQAYPHGRHVGCVEALGAAVQIMTTKWAPPPRPATPVQRERDPFAALGSDVDFMRVPL